MKAIGGRMTRGVQTGSMLTCADNSGARELQLIAVKGHKGTKRRYAAAGVGDLIICSVKKGDPKVRKEVVAAVVVRQRKEWRRPDGMRVKFDDNAAVLVNERNEPKGTEIKGPIAKEVVRRYLAVGKIASIVV